MIIPHELHRLKSLLDSFLGPSKKELDDTLQLEYPCPRCREEHGTKEDRKYNLSISLSKQFFNCWKCSSVHDEMHGSILKLIRLYGNDDIAKEYKDTIYAFKQSKLYELSFNKEDFNIDYNLAEHKEVELPSNFVRFKQNDFNPKKPLQYLSDRGIGWDIINKYKIGYTTYDTTQKQVSSRIIIPSFNEYGELNYWTGRDFTTLKHRQKYYNPIIERKDIIFNEEHIQWDADITLVEGPFDHIVVPNSIPLLGKALKPNFDIYQKLIKRANACVNIFLDADAIHDVQEIYGMLNHNQLYGKIRYIPVSGDLDPAKIYEIDGPRGIAQHLRNATQINDVYLT